MTGYLIYPNGRVMALSAITSHHEVERPSGKRVEMVDQTGRLIIWQGDLDSLKAATVQDDPGDSQQQ